MPILFHYRLLLLIYINTTQTGLIVINQKHSFFSLHIYLKKIKYLTLWFQKYLNQFRNIIYYINHINIILLNYIIHLDNITHTIYNIYTQYNIICIILSYIYIHII